MKSFSLSNKDRELLCKRLLHRRFKEDADHLVTQGQYVALKAYNHCFTKAERERMEGLPKGWLPETHVAVISVGGQRHDLPFNGCLAGKLAAYASREAQHRCRDRYPIPVKNTGGHHAQVIGSVEATAKLADEITEWRRAAADFGSTVTRVGKEIQAVLAQVKTSKQLLELWPETEEFLAALPKATAAPKLPAITITKLNEELDLP